MARPPLPMTSTFLTSTLWWFLIRALSRYALVLGDASVEAVAALYERSTETVPSFLVCLAVCRATRGDVRSVVRDRVGEASIRGMRRPARSTTGARPARAAGTLASMTAKNCLREGREINSMLRGCVPRASLQELGGQLHRNSVWFDDEIARRNTFVCGVPAD